jgi:hypothetical protein
MPSDEIDTIHYMYSYPQNDVTIIQNFVGYFFFSFFFLVVVVGGRGGVTCTYEVLELCGEVDT